MGRRRNRLNEKKETADTKVQTSLRLWFSGCVKPGCRKQDLCHLIKLLYNYLYLQLHEAGSGELMALWAKQRGRNFCPLPLIVPKIWEQHSWVCRPHVLFGGYSHASCIRATSIWEVITPGSSVHFTLCYTAVVLNTDGAFKKRCIIV